MQRYVLAFVAAVLCSAAELAHGGGKLFEVSYPASSQPGELSLDVTFQVWVPAGPARLRGVIVHQHGCGFAANAAGETAVHDLHWQALAAKWDCTLLSPRYKQTTQGREGCQPWSDPRNGSRDTLLRALGDLGEKCGHPELRTAPWCLWGHSGGAYWVSLMQASDPERIVAAWLRSGTAFAWWESGELAKPQLSAAVDRIPTMLNPGIGEKSVDRPEAAWLGSLAMFNAYRARGALIGFVADPRSGHDCGDSRYLAIPYFDACLAQRLPPVAQPNAGLQPMDEQQAWLAPLLSDQTSPAAKFTGNPQQSVWLPTERVAQAYSEYVRTGATNDTTPPPHPTQVAVARSESGCEITWQAEADFESGLQGFLIHRDGRLLAKLPEAPAGKYGRPLFQELSFHDTPEQPLPAMRFVDTTAAPGVAQAYQVIAVNSVGLQSAPAAPTGEPQPAPALQSPLGKIAVADGDTIVFLGDSITAQCLYTQFIENYFYTRFPKLRLKFHNAGVSGDTAADALVRFDRDVAAYRPKYVTLLLGMNDGASTRFDASLFEQYRVDLQKLIDRIRAIGATPILITPTMYDLRAKTLNSRPDSRGRGGYYNGVLALYGSWLRETAAEQGLGFVDAYSLLNHFTYQARKTDPKFTLIPDGIHPDAGGQIIMAYALVSDLGLSRRISTIDVARGDNDRAVVKVTGGTISAARFDSAGLEFMFQPASLPLSVPAEAKVGANLIPLGHRMSYEALYVHGLPAGQYQLAINEQIVGTYAAGVLESKVELQSNERTPQYQQAQRVAELNAERNAQCVAPLRDLWRAQKTLARSKRELAAAPADETLKNRVRAYERKLADFDAQVQALALKSQLIEDQIYQANQPQSLRFRFTRAAEAAAKQQ